MGGLFLDSGSTFSYNQADYGGVIHCSGCDNLTFTGSTFYKNRAIEGGVFYLTSNSSLYDTQSTFRQNYAVRGALFKCSDCKAELSETKIMQNECDKGCVMYSDSYLVQILMSKVNISDNSALSSGAVAYITEGGDNSNKTEMWLKVFQCNFTWNTAKIGEAGLIYLSH